MNNPENAVSAAGVVYVNPTPEKAPLLKFSISLPYMTKSNLSVGETEPVLN